MAYLCDNELLDIYLGGYLTVETTQFLGLVDISFKVFLKYIIFASDKKLNSINR